MYKRLILATALLAYTAILVKVMIFKQMPVLHFGGMMLKMGGTETGEANLIPFKTIIPYLLGHKGLLIAGINIAGNIVLLIPFGFLVPLVFRGMTWKHALALAVAFPLFVEVSQVLLGLGIFDIDDVILNGIGVVLGYGVFVFIWRKAL
jgi:glycopeptide antibiotics resistance protein